MSEILTKKAGDIGTIAYNVAWFNMTAKDKNAISMVIMRTHEEYRLDALGLFKCSYASYLQVFEYNFSFSYFIAE